MEILRPKQTTDMEKNIILFATQKLTVPKNLAMSQNYFEAIMKQDMYKYAHTYMRKCSCTLAVCVCVRFCGWVY